MKLITSNFINFFLFGYSLSPFLLQNGNVPLNYVKAIKYIHIQLHHPSEQNLLFCGTVQFNMKKNEKKKQSKHILSAIRKNKVFQLSFFKSFSLKNQ